VNNENFNSPVLFLVFNRLDTVKKVLQEINKAKPSVLYVACDGPRNNEERNPLSPPLRSPQQRPQGHPAKSKFLAVCRITWQKRSFLPTSIPRKIAGIDNGFIVFGL